MKNFEKLFTPSFTFIIGVFYILLIYIFYKYKNVYNFLFVNPLGYIIIIILIGSSYYLNKWFGLLMGFALGLLYILSRSINYFVNINANVKEGFEPWSQETIDEFEDFVTTNNPNLIYDLSNVQQQASETEAKILLKTGKWPWDKTTRDLFEENVGTNTMINNVPKDSMEIARKIYNQNITKQLLSWKAPEGQMLMTGAFVEDASGSQTETDSNGNTYGIASGLVSSNKSLIKCGKSESTGELMMQMHKSMGNDGIFGSHQEQVTDVDYNELPNLIKGFTFIDQPCNPCVALNNPPEYTCKFSLSNGIDGVSSIWKNLWGIDESEPSTVEEDSLMNNKSQKEFPLLYKLKSELNSALSSSETTTESKYQPYTKDQLSFQSKGNKNKTN